MSDTIITAIAKSLRESQGAIPFDMNTSNLLFTESFQRVTDNRLLRDLLPAPKRSLTDEIKYRAQEPMLLSANMRDNKSGSYEVPMPGYKEGLTSGFRVAEHVAMNREEMSLFWQLGEASGLRLEVLGDQTADVIQRNTDVLTTRYAMLFLNLIVNAFSGDMKYPVKEDDGTVTIQSVPTGIVTVDKTATAPWDALTTTDIPEQFNEVKAITKHGKVDTAYMSNATAEIMFKNESVQKLLCCESLQVALRDSIDGAIGSIRNIRLVVLDFEENEYELPDGTRAQLIPDGEVFFANTNRLFGHSRRFGSAPPPSGRPPR